MVDTLDDDWWEKTEPSEETEGLDDTSDHSGNKRKNKEGEEPKSKKRKDSAEITEDHGSDASEHELSETNENQPKKKKKRNRKKITTELKSLVEKAPVPDDLIAVINKTYKDKLTGVEWDEIQLQDDHFCKVSNGEHTANSYLKEALPKWKKLKAQFSTDPGKPLVLIITSAAIRAVDLNRDITSFKGEDCKIMKLFAKHIKLEEQTKQLQKSAFHIGIGTPNRIQALLENGSLKLDNLYRIILDWRWRNTKQKRLIDIPEIKDHLLTLFKDHLIPAIKKNERARIGLL